MVITTALIGKAAGGAKDKKASKAKEAAPSNSPTAASGFAGTPKGNGASSYPAGSEPARNY
jgi:hypothetical protein